VAGAAWGGDRPGGRARPPSGTARAAPPPPRLLDAPTPPPGQLGAARLVDRRADRQRARPVAGRLAAGRDRAGTLPVGTAVHQAGRPDPARWGSGRVEETRRRRGAGGSGRRSGATAGTVTASGGAGHARRRWAGQAGTPNRRRVQRDRPARAG